MRTERNLHESRSAHNNDEVATTITTRPSALYLPLALMFYWSALSQ